MGALFKIHLIFLVIHCSYSATLSGYKSYQNYRVYSVNNGAGLQKLINALKTHDNQLSHKSTSTKTQILVAPHLVQVFETYVAANKLDSQLVLDNFAEVIREEKLGATRAKEFGWKAYYDVDDVYGYLKKMNQQYSNSTELIIGGKSFEKRQIVGLRINTKEHGPDKHIIFIETGIHAREWIGPATTTYFINELLTSSDPEIQAIRDQLDWHIFPIVNPDGYHYSYTVDRMWRKTRSKSSSSECYGADPNRNWDYNWMQSGTSHHPCEETYGGSKPFSEPETKSLSEYISKLENLNAYIAFHSAAQMLLVPYSDSEKHNDNYDDLIQIGNTSLEFGYNVNHERYYGPATAAEILYECSGVSMDWVRHALGTPIVYTYELRGNGFHWPPERIHEQGDEVTQMMLGLIKKAKDMGYF